jgi:hypothetical protein
MKSPRVFFLNFPKLIVDPFGYIAKTHLTFSLNTHI